MNVNDAASRSGFRVTRMRLDENLRPSMIIDDLPFIPVVRRFVVEKYRQMTEFVKLVFFWRADLWNIFMALLGLGVLLLCIHYKRLLPRQLQRKNKYA